MTVKQLKAELAKLDPEMDNCQVIMSKDSEGNSYSPIYDVYNDCYCDDAKEYHIDSIYTDVYTAEENGFDSEEEWEAYKKKADRVIVFYPTN